VKYSKEIPAIFRNEGGLALYNGALCQLMRDVPAWGFYFWSYASCKAYFGLNEEVLDRSSRDIALLMHCSGMAGVLSWVSSYPFDIVNTIIKCEKPENMKQGTSFKVLRQYKALRITDILVKNYRAHGIAFFFTGFYATCARAYVCNFPVLPIFEFLNTYMKPYVL